MLNLQEGTFGFFKGTNATRTWWKINNGKYNMDEYQQVLEFNGNSRYKGRVKTVWLTWFVLLLTEYATADMEHHHWNCLSPLTWCMWLTQSIVQSVSVFEMGGRGPKTPKMASKWPQISWLFLFLYDLSEKQKKFGFFTVTWQMWQMENLGKNYHPYIPAIVFGVNALLAGILAIMLPETHGRDLPYTIEVDVSNHK